MKKLLLLGFSVLLAGSAAQSQMNPGQLKWGPGPPALPAGAQLAVLSGDPAKAGLFTIRLRFPAGYRVMPHRHPSDELVTVISGETALGMGRAFNPSRATRMVQGGFVVAPANMNHYAFTRTGAIIQITARGPFQVIYVNPKDDPRNRPR